MEMIRAPQLPPPDAPRPWVFLAGSIDEGGAEPWQERVAAAYKDLPGVLLNPRREDWDPSWSNAPAGEDGPLQDQVSWELTHLASADKIILYLAGESAAPISLMELGLYAASGKIDVICEPTFWRTMNVTMTCAYHNAPLFDNLHAYLNDQPVLADETVRPLLDTK